MGKLKKTAAGLAVSAILLIAVEGALRVVMREVGLATIPKEQVQIAVKGDDLAYHPVLGWVHEDLPNEALGINEDGFRHEPVPMEKPSGTWRAFAIGDSQTMGSGVEAHHTWPSVAEARLRMSVGAEPRVELINAAVAGYTSLHALRLIKHKLLDWDPDLILIDCRTFDSPRDDVFAGSDGGDLDRRLVFSSRIYWVLHFLLDRGLSDPPRIPGPEGLSRPASDLQDRFGNHGLITDLLHEEGRQVLFVDYPIHATADMVAPDTRSIVYERLDGVLKLVFSSLRRRNRAQMLQQHRREDIER